MGAWRHFKHCRGQRASNPGDILRFCPYAAAFGWNGHVLRSMQQGHVMFPSPDGKRCIGQYHQFRNQVVSGRRGVVHIQHDTGFFPVPLK